ncbi:MAG: acyl carrier protein [Alphaproteobacteria bacterium]|nr:acyl carrier protein [Alphaproteobacteria bacterium]MBU2380410.1 acyl carrier protein [Alphaproteobacteria bacterium]
MQSMVADLTERQIAKAVEKVLDRPVRIQRTTDISRDLAVDSLALMNIVMELEDTFDISIPLDRLAQVETVGDLADIISSLRPAA